MGLFSRSRTPGIHFRLITYVLIIPILMFYVLAIVGSVSNSPGIPNIFIASLSERGDNAGPHSGFDVHVGYFGLCAGLSQHLTCVASIGAGVDHLIASIADNSNATSSSILTDSTNKALIDIALTIQSKTIYWVLIAAGLAFLLALLVLLLLQLHQKKAQPKPNAARKKLILKRLLLTCAWASTALIFAAALSTTQTATNFRHTAAPGPNAAQHISHSFISDTLVIDPGVVLQTLQWLAFSFSFFFCTGVSTVFMSAGGGGPKLGGSAPLGMKQSISTEPW